MKSIAGQRVQLPLAQKRVAVRKGIVAQAAKPAIAEKTKVTGMTPEIAKDLYRCACEVLNLHYPRPKILSIHLSPLSGISPEFSWKEK